MALSVVVGGVALAWLVGRSDPTPRTDAPQAADRIALKRRATVQTLEVAGELRAAPDGEATAASSSFRISEGAAAPVQGGKPDALPPSLAPSFPAVDPPASARWGVSLGIAMPGAGIVEQAARSHKIANGDSLSSLAKRYLGSEDHAGEIFEANRDVLASPDALPIGVELKIPPRKAVKPSAEPPKGSPPLVPIAPRGSRSPEGGAS